MNYDIYYPDKMSEFEVQSVIFGTLRKLGYKVRGEVKAKRSRLDIVVFDEQKKALCIIEVKARGRLRKNPRKYKQVAKYEELFGLPVIVCLNRARVAETIERVKSIVNGT